MTLMKLDIGGAETHVLELSKALKAKGLEVYVASRGGVYVKELEEAGITHFSVPLHNKRLQNMISSYKTLKNIIIDNDIRLVHAHARIPAFLCGLLSKKLHFRFVTTAHFPFSTLFPFKLLSNWGEKTLSVSEDIKQYLIKNYKIKNNDIRLTVNGIDTVKFSADTGYEDIISEFGLDINKKRIVFLSRLDKEATSPAHQLLRCAERIYNSCNDIEIIIVGSGDDYNELSVKAQSVNEKLGRKVVYMTGSRTTDVNKFLAAAHIFVGVSRAALEAMCCRPVILSGKEGYLGIFGSESTETAIKTNFCCRNCGFASDERLIKDILSLLRMDEAGLQKLADYCRETIIKHYSVEKMTQDALEIYESVRSRKKEIDVMISGYYGFKNSGDDFVLKAIIESLKSRRKNIRILTLSHKPAETSSLYGVDSINRLNIPAINKYLKKTNLLITGGGTLIQDLTSTKSLWYYLYIISSARKRGARNMLYAHGVSIKRKNNKPLVRKVLDKTDIITLREADSLKILKEIGVSRPETYVTADAAFSLSNKSNTSSEQTMKILSDIGINNSKYFIVAVRSWKQLKAGFEEEIAVFADSIKEKYGYEALFVPMQPNKDSKISKRCISLMRKPGVYAGNRDAVDVFNIVSKAEFILSMPLHTVIYAAITGVPAIALIYDPKVKSMMDNLGQKCYMDARETNSPKLLGFAENILSDRKKAAKNMLEAGKKESAKAAENARLVFELLDRKEF